MHKYTINLEQIRRIAHDSSGEINRARHRAYKECSEGHDLPGLWPHLYVYSDMSWSVEYSPNPARVLISKTMAEPLCTAALEEAIRFGLQDNCEFVELVVVIKHEEIKPTVEIKRRGRPKKQAEKGQQRFF
jgi:hypothetical protein